MRPHPHDVVALVEANTYERLGIWQEYHRSLNWREISMGTFETIGHMMNAKGEKMPVCVQVFFDIVNGKVIGFWDGVSSCVDYPLIHDWLNKTYPRAKARSDAMNFHNVLLDLEIKADLKVCDVCRSLH